jgi:hypothetical protein
MTDQSSSRPRRVDATIFLVAVVLAVIPVAASLSRHDYDPTALLRVGTFSASRPFVERDFGHTVLTPDAGHDGQQFYVLAVTFPDLQAADGYVDKLPYRARRVLVPAVTALVPRGAPLVWTTLAINLVAIGAAAVAVAQLARRLRVSPWLGLTVGVTPALLESARGSLSDAPAFALALWGVVVWRRKPWLAAGLFLFAALARETTLVVPIACALVGPKSVRGPMLVPLLGWLAWAATVVVWLPADPTARSTNPVSDALVQLDLPFRGWVEIGLTEATVLGALLLAASLAAALALRHDLPEISLWLLADAVLLVLSVRGVIERPENFARVAPLAVPAVALAVASRWRDYLQVLGSARAEAFTGRNRGRNGAGDA